MLFSCFYTFFLLSLVGAAKIPPSPSNLVLNSNAGTVREASIPFLPGMELGFFQSLFQSATFAPIPEWSLKHLKLAFLYFRFATIIEGSCKKGCQDDKHRPGCSFYPDRQLFHSEWRADCDARALTVNLALYRAGIARLKDDETSAPEIRFQWRASNSNQVPKRMLKQKGMKPPTPLLPKVMTEELAHLEKSLLPFIPANIFIFPKQNDHIRVVKGEEEIEWKYHVAPLVKVMDYKKNQEMYYVLDYAMDDNKPILLTSWLKRMRGITKISICSGLAWSLSDPCRQHETKVKALEEAEYLRTILFVSTGSAYDNPVVADIRADVHEREKARLLRTSVSAPNIIQYSQIKNEKSRALVRVTPVDLKVTSVSQEKGANTDTLISKPAIA